MATNEFKRKALLFGATIYRDPSIDALSGDNDIRIWSNTLICYHGYEESDIRAFTGTDATVKNLILALYDYICTLNENDHLFFLLSTHGEYKDEEKEHLIQLYDNYIPGDLIYLLFKAFKPGVHITFVTDICESGKLIEFVKNPSLTDGEKRRIENDLSSVDTAVCSDIMDLLQATDNLPLSCSVAHLSSVNEIALSIDSLLSQSVELFYEENSAVSIELLRKQLARRQAQIIGTMDLNTQNLTGKFRENQDKLIKLCYTDPSVNRFVATGNDLKGKPVLDFIRSRYQSKRYRVDFCQSMRNKITEEDIRIVKMITDESSLKRLKEIIDDLELYNHYYSGDFPVLFFGGAPSDLFRNNKAFQTN